MARVVICAAATRQLDPLAVAFRETGVWDVVAVVSPALPPARQPADIHVLCIRDVVLGESEQLAWRPASGPSLLVLGTPTGRFDADAWLPESSPAGLVIAVASQLLVRGAGRDAEGPIPAPWRRKSDMLVGNSPATRHLLRVLDRVAAGSEPFTIIGEPGTGKALVAQALHYCGPRARTRLSSVHCSGLAEHAFDEELATGSTLLLEEICELSRPLQSKLVRALEKGTFIRSGTRAPETLAARVVATTAHDPEADVRSGGFEEELWGLLRRSLVRVLPLRDRAEDIAPIVHHHLALIARREKQNAPSLTAQALERLLAYGWPGNVRELVDALERAFLMAEDGLIDVHHVVVGGVPVSAERLKVALPSFRDAKSSFEFAYYSQLMRITGGNVSLAAKLAIKTRKEIYDALRRLGLNATAYRGPMAAGGS